MSLEQWQHARSILCIRLDYLGDVLMCTPAIRALKQSARGRHITLLTSESGAAAARHVPEIDTCIEYAAPWMKSSASHRPDADLEMAAKLRDRHFDAAVIFTTYSQSALPAAMLCYLAEIPLRLAHCRENPYQLLSDWIKDPEPQQFVRHEVRRQLDLVAEAGCRTDDERLSFRVAPSDATWAEQILHELGMEDTSLWILLHPGATAASRRYPPELWAKTADLLAQRLDCSLLFTGGKNEIALVESIRRGMRAASHSLAGELELGQLAAVIEHAPVMVTGNTGPAHIAAATGTPIVDLYALTNPQHTPWMVPSRVLYHDVSCRNCYKSICPLQHNACLAGIEPQRIADAVLELLEGTAGQAIGTEAEAVFLDTVSHETVSSPLPVSGWSNSIMSS